MIDIIKDYDSQPAFADFLPGIAGENGIPAWCFFVNRGQGVASFGTQDKDHPIMEFRPAHTAWQDVQTKGFRTFLKYHGHVSELFVNARDKQMLLGGKQLDASVPGNGCPGSCPGPVFYFTECVRWSAGKDADN